MLVVVSLIVLLTCFHDFSHGASHPYIAIRMIFTLDPHNINFFMARICGRKLLTDYLPNFRFMILSAYGIPPGRLRRFVYA